MRFIVIGGAICDLPQALKDNNSKPLWKRMTDIADALLHEYYAIDTNVVWTTVERDIPALKTLIRTLS